MELTPLAWWETSQLERSDSDSRQGQYGVVDCKAHSPYLSIPALAKGDVQNRGVVHGIKVDEQHFRRCGQSVLQLDTPGKAFDCLREHLPADDGAIGLGDFVAGVRKKLRELPVIREDEQASGIGV